MIKFYSLLVIIILVFGLSSISFSQSELSLHVTAGYSQPVGDFNNGISFHDTVSSKWPYQMRTAYNMGVTGKLALDKKRNIKLVLGLNYNGFKNWGNVEETTVYDPSGNGNLITDTVEFLPKVAILSLSIGGEYNFKPKSKINPFAGLGITCNFYSGSFQSIPSSYFPKNQLNVETRFGFEVGGGVDVKLGKVAGVILGAKYNLANLIGKNDDFVPDNNLVYLDDKDHGDQSARSTSYFQLYAGFSFYFDDLFHKKVLSIEY